MILKPRSSVGNPPALLYKRFTTIEDSETRYLYRTSDGDFWFFQTSNESEYLFTAENVPFLTSDRVFFQLAQGYAEVDVGFIPFHILAPEPIYLATASDELLLDASERLLQLPEPYTAPQIDMNIINVEDGAIFIHDRVYYQYVDGSWVAGDATTLGITLLSTDFKDIAGYQINKYYYFGSFDYMIKGSVEGTTVQYVKGLITPTTAFNIRTFTDDLDVKPHDFVVVDGNLFSVENSETIIKRMPSAFRITYLTLTNIGSYEDGE